MLAKFLREKGSQNPRKMGWFDLNSNHPTHYKFQVFTDEVLQCVFDKYAITY